MNERIRELFHESIEDCDGTMKDRVYSLKQSEIEKFAELIVRECADIVDRAISDGGVDGRMIKEHFGVEE